MGIDIAVANMADAQPQVSTQAHGGCTSHDLNVVVLGRPTSPLAAQNFDVVLCPCDRRSSVIDHWISNFGGMGSGARPFTTFVIFSLHAMGRERWSWVFKLLSPASIQDGIAHFASKRPGTPRTSKGKTLLTMNLLAFAIG